jgi:hypothetical protein
MWHGLGPAVLAAVLALAVPAAADAASAGVARAGGAAGEDHAARAWSAGTADDRPAAEGVTRGPRHDGPAAEDATRGPRHDGADPGNGPGANAWGARPSECGVPGGEGARRPASAQPATCPDGGPAGGESPGAGAVPPPSPSAGGASVPGAATQTPWRADAGTVDAEGAGTQAAAGADGAAGAVAAYTFPPDLIASVHHGPRATSLALRLSRARCHSAGCTATVWTAAAAASVRVVLRRGSKPICWVTRGAAPRPERVVLTPAERLRPGRYTVVATVRTAAGATRSATTRVTVR